jgi:hypothetical protein
LYRTPVIYKDVTFDPVPLYIICVRLGPSISGVYVCARVLVPLKPGCDKMPERRRCLPEGCLGSRVDAPQKPNCRSPVQGLERQGLRKHLPSCSSVRADLRDGNTHTCGWTVILKWFCSGVPSDRRSPLLTSSRKGSRRRRVSHAADQETGI